jgi:hypothetical protein
VESRDGSCPLGVLHQRMEQAEPRGVSWMTRKASPAR